MSKSKHEVSREDNFTLYLKKASEEVQSWPVWKQTALGIGNSSYSLKHAEINHENQKKDKSK
jgi:hypothetical protein